MLILKSHADNNGRSDSIRPVRPVGVKRDEIIHLRKHNETRPDRLPSRTKSKVKVFGHARLAHTKISTILLDARIIRQRSRPRAPKIIHLNGGGQKYERCRRRWANERYATCVTCGTRTARKPRGKLHRCITTTRRALTTKRGTSTKRLNGT